MKRLALLTMAAVTLSGCASRKLAMTSADYTRASDYQDRALLQQSLFRSDQALLSNDEIDAILSSRIQLPARAHLTILRLGSTDEVLAWALLSGSASPFGDLANAPRLSRLSWLPALLVPEKLNVPALREAAARFQADLLLVYRTPCQQFSNYRLFGTDTSKTYCVAEGLLLDIRTGVIPFSAAAVHEVRAAESKEDVDFYETLRKAKATASAEAVRDLSRQLSAFLSDAP